MNCESNQIFDKAIFIISLDVELLWGFVEHPSSESIYLLRNDTEKGRGCINALLNLFEKHNISATWAVVGHLLLSCDQLHNENAYNKIKRFKRNLSLMEGNQNDQLYYGKDIIKRILSQGVVHEIGYHSFSHVVFSECTPEIADAEIKAGIELAKDFGITLESFVFPENKIGNVDLLKENNFKIYRGENSGGYKPNQKYFIRKLKGGINKIFAHPVEPKCVDGIWEIQSSMFFCDPQIKLSVLPRAKLGLFRAIQAKKIFHIYLHPHNLLMYPSLIVDLDNFLRIVSKKREMGQLDVMTMGQFASKLNGDENIGV